MKFVAFNVKRPLARLLCACSLLLSSLRGEETETTPVPSEIRLLDKDARILLSRSGVPLALAQLRPVPHGNHAPRPVLTFEEAKRVLAAMPADQALKQGADQLRELHFPLGRTGAADQLNVLLRAKKSATGARILVSSTVLSETAPPPLGTYEWVVQIFSGDGKLPDILHVDGVKEAAQFDVPFTRRARTWSIEKKDFRVALSRTGATDWNVRASGGDVFLTARLLPDSRHASELGSFVIYMGTSADGAGPELSPLRLDKLETPARDFIEGRVRVYSSGSNPFLLSETAVVAEVAFPPSPNGEVPIKRLPCFFWEAPSRAPAESEFRFRFAPPAEGIYGVRIAAVTPFGQARTDALSFRAGPPASPGAPRIFPNERFFRLDDGRPWIPIGCDLSALAAPNAAAYRAQFTQILRAGGNAARISLSLNALQLEKNAGQYDADIASEIDEILRAAQARGISVILCAERAGDISRQSARHPYFRERGGPLAATPEFFRNVAAKRFFQNRVTYLAARYGAFRSVWSWELLESVDACWPILKQNPDTAKLKMTEIDLARRARRDVQEWIDEMAVYLRGMDSHDHPISVSLTLNPDTPWLDLERSENIDWIATRPELPALDERARDDKNRDASSLLAAWAIVSRQPNRRVRPFAVLDLVAPGAAPTGAIQNQIQWASLAAGFAAPLLVPVDAAGTRTLLDFSGSAAFAAGLAAVLDGEARDAGRFIDEDSPAKDQMPLRITGRISTTGAALWIRDKRSTTAADTAGADIVRAEVPLAGFRPGRYSVMWLDTSSGSVLASETIVALELKSGQPLSQVVLKMPPVFKRDIAVVILPQK